MFATFKTLIGFPFVDVCL